MPEVNTINVNKITATLAVGVATTLVALVGSPAQAAPAVA
jgi:hypothetical protein